MRDRYGVVLLALLINVICYADRVCISVAGPRMRDEFGFTPAQMGWVFGIFSLSYALMQAPWGILAERVGARVMVTAAVLSWSVFTALTGFAWSLWSLLAIRFTFGVLEAALSPSIATAFRRWIPAEERSAAFGFFLGGGRLGGAITPFFTGLLMVRFGWRGMFYFFGALGLAAAGAWFARYRNRAAEERGPVARTGNETWRGILRSPRFWSLLGVAFGATLLWQFYITWFPTYLMEHRRMSLEEASVFAGLPFLLGLGSTWLGGLVTDVLARRTGVYKARRIVGFVSLASAALLMSAGLWCPPAKPAALLMAMAAGAVDLYLGAAWASALDIGGRLGGGVAGLMNSASNGAGFLSPILTGQMLQWTGNWHYPLAASVCTTGIAAVLWLGVTSDQRE